MSHNNSFSNDIIVFQITGTKRALEPVWKRRPHRFGSANFAKHFSFHEKWCYRGVILGKNTKYVAKFVILWRNLNT
jgi:hypothetical protein